MSYSPTEGASPSMTYEHFAGPTATTVREVASGPSWSSTPLRSHSKPPAALPARARQVGARARQTGPWVRPRACRLAGEHADSASWERGP